MKRKSSWMLLSVAMLLLLAACGGNAGNAVSTESPAAPAGSGEPAASAVPDPKDAKFELNVMTWFTDETRQNLMKETIAKFNEKYPNVKVNHSGNEDYGQAYKLAFNSGAAPDLVYLDDLNQQDLEEYDYLLDITDDVKRMGWMDKLMPNSIEFNNQRHPGTYKSVGFISYPRALFYNKDIMDKLGLSAPTSLDELNGQLAAIKAAGYTPWEASETHMLWLIYSIVLGSVPAEDIDKWYFLKETTPAFRQAYIQALATVEDWIKKGYFRKEIATVKSADVVTLFNRNETVFLLSGDSTAKTLEEYPFNIGVTVFPNKDTSLPKTLVSAIDGSWALSSGIAAEKKQAALDFIDTFMDPDIARKWLEAGYSVTVNFDKSGIELSELHKATLAATSNTRVGYFLDNAVPGLLDLLIQLNQRLEVGDITAQQYWDLMDAEYEKLKAEYNK